MVFLYMNGLHGSTSDMKGFFTAMGADSRWGGTDKNNKIGDAGQEEEVKRIKIDANSNLALVYCKMGDGEKVSLWFWRCACVGDCRIIEPPPSNLSTTLTDPPPPPI